MMPGTGLHLFKGQWKTPLHHYTTHIPSQRQSLLINSFPITYNPKKTNKKKLREVSELPKVKQAVNRVARTRTKLSASF